MRSEIKTTTDRRTYRLLRFKELDLDVWSYSDLHRLYGDRYFRSSDDDVARHGRSYPNWKMVSKNKKQWMTKPLKLVYHYHNPWDQTDTWELVW